MEKRFFLAVLLSFVVLYGWTILNPPPKPPQKTIKNSQAIENKEFINQNKEVLDNSSPSSQQFTKPLEQEYSNTGTEPQIDYSEKFETLESDKFILHFSNIGGTIDKIYLKEFDKELSLKGITTVGGYESLPFQVEEKNDARIVFSYEDAGYKLSKVYQMSKEDYIINSDIIFQNKTNMSKQRDVVINSYTVDGYRLDKKIKNGNGALERDKSLLEYVIYSDDGIHRKSNAYKFASKENKSKEHQVNWAGYRDKYFCTLIKPQFETHGYNINVIDEKLLKIEVESTNINIPAGGSVSFSSIIYSGPERLDILKKYELGFEKVKKFYRFALFDVIALILYYILHAIHALIPNWGICILLIGVLIYFSMYPLTLSSMSSMKKMQELQPKVQALKEKYKNNPQKMQTEMMEIYKREKVNPVGGCLPILFQMPVFIGLYQVLLRDVSFKGAKFLWIKDLSEPDRLFLMPFKLPFIGNEFNLLPVLMMIIMFVQTRFQAKNMTLTDPAQLAQQRMMGMVMPVFLGVIFYKFASGLTMYFTLFYAFSTFTQWKMSKKPKAA